MIPQFLGQICHQGSSGISITGDFLSGNGPLCATGSFAGQGSFQGSGNITGYGSFWFLGTCSGYAQYAETLEGTGNYSMSEIWAVSFLESGNEAFTGNGFFSGYGLISGAYSSFSGVGLWGGFGYFKANGVYNVDGIVTGSGALSVCNDWWLQTGTSPYCNEFQFFGSSGTSGTFDLCDWYEGFIPISGSGLYGIIDISGFSLTGFVNVSGYSGISAFIDISGGTGTYGGSILAD